MDIFYTELAAYWPLISPVADYEEEAAEFLRVLDDALPSARTALELGSGGGHNAFYLKRRFEMTLSDLSEAMLAVSAALNPECEHVVGDMRSLRVGRQFDVVFVHDAVDYMCTEAELAAAIATAYAHCRPGGVALLVPDMIEGRLEPGTDWGGADGPDGRGVRYLEWTYDLDPHDGRGTTHYVFAVRDAAGTVRSLSESHEFGVHAEATWLRLLTERGFVVEVLEERTTEERTPRRMFLARRPPDSRADERTG